jgi:hypothetical protein
MAGGLGDRLRKRIERKMAHHPNWVF